MSNTRTNYAINSVRTIAAFAVVISHLRALYFVDYEDSSSTDVFTRAFYLLTSLGHQAVIVFFVLSGFWVGGSVIRAMQRDSFTWRGYATARLSRLWLVLIPAVLLTQILDRVGTWLAPASDLYSGSPAYHGVIPVDGATNHLGLLETVGNILFVQSIHVETLGTNSPLWSLAYEFWYYLLFPLLLLVFSRRLKLGTRVLLIVALALSVLVAGPEVLALFPAWIVGALLAWQAPRIRAAFGTVSYATLNVCRLAAVGLTLGAAAFSSAAEQNEYLEDLLIAAPTLLLLASFLIDAKEGRLTSVTLRPLSAAAEWSYSLYAIHVPALTFAAAVLIPAAVDRWDLSPSTFAWFALLTVGTGWAGFLFSLATERQTPRLRALLDGLFPRKDAVRV
jgi:peptidoglycan/LPS O-acetylase OafA/YrhL